MSRQYLMKYRSDKALSLEKVAHSPVATKLGALINCQSLTYREKTASRSLLRLESNSRFTDLKYFLWVSTNLILLQLPGWSNYIKCILVAPCQDFQPLSQSNVGDPYLFRDISPETVLDDRGALTLWRPLPEPLTFGLELTVGKVGSLEPHQATTGPWSRLSGHKGPEACLRGWLAAQIYHPGSMKSLFGPLGSDCARKWVLLMQIGERVISLTT